MNVEVECRKLIKPLAPTLPDRCNYKISVADEVNPAMHIIRIIYYPSVNEYRKVVMNLEESLARILPLFYPLAGRYIREQKTVDCNDEGAEFSVAQVLGCSLLTVAAASSVAPEQLNCLLPVDVAAVDEPWDPLLAVQINRFVECGSVAIGICISHRVFDSTSVATFVSAWADAARRGGVPSIEPDFDMLPSLFPSENLPTLDMGITRDTSDRVGGPAANANIVSTVGKIFMFDKNLISALRDSVSSTPGWRSSASGAAARRPPSRVLAVSGVMAQAFMRADRAKHGGGPGGSYKRGSVIGQMIDVRERTVPPVPRHACGTWVSSSYLEHTAEESLALEHDYPCMILKLRAANAKVMEDCKRLLSDKEFGRWTMIGSSIDVIKKITSPDFNFVWITDLSKFGCYELDFGFGKPSWVSLAHLPVNDFIVLMNTKDNDGIEAWVYLHESDIPFFEKEFKDIIRNNIIKIDDGGDACL
ncbi:hypothetical protein ABFX02_07G065400 [Erythranthe guttata]